MAEATGVEGGADEEVEAEAGEDMVDLVHTPGLAAGHPGEVPRALLLVDLLLGLPQDDKVEEAEVEADTVDDTLHRVEIEVEVEVGEALAIAHMVAVVLETAVGVGIVDEK